jgi:hypothetical protein
MSGRRDAQDALVSPKPMDGREATNDALGPVARKCRDEDRAAVCMPGLDLLFGRWVRPGRRVGSVNRFRPVVSGADAPLVVTLVQHQSKYACEHSLRL